ncbi:MAG TPA: hypothetical protein VJR89_37940 [Polyangiales bacterium]|nr:hypothetical protein [Polyangiales bacterium]
MLDNCGDSVGFPEAEDDAPCVDQGRLAGLFLRLHARRFTGLAYVNADERTLTFAFRDGTPVSIDEPLTESSLADDFVERGLLSRDDYAQVIARVTEDLVENEDVAFCEHAVRLGFLSEEQVRAELSERVRSKLIQSMSFSNCEVQLDEDQEALLAIAEYPQKLGAAVYMGVRTFYEEDVLRGYLPDLKRNFMRLLKAPAEIARFFELDYEEVALLNAVDPQLRAAGWLASCDLEESHAQQLIALLLIGRMCEFSPTPFAQQEAERSGVRSAAQRPLSRPLTPGLDTGRPGSRMAMPAIREEVFEPRSVSRGAVPAVQAPRPESGPAFDPRVEPGSVPATARREGSGAHQSPLQAPGRREGSGAHQSPVQPRAPSGTLREPAAPVVDAAAEALAEARARAREAGKRGGSYAALRLGREIETQRKSSSMANPAARPESSTSTPAARTPSSSATPAARAPAPSVVQPAAADTPEYQKQHLKELMKRRLAASGGGPAEAPGGARKDPTRELRHAQELLRDVQYARAEEVLRALVEQTPNDDTVRAYHLWAQLRASHNLDAGQLTTLRDLAKKMVSDEDTAGFGCYVLGHLYLADKKDEQAEKYFRKAHQLDKTNKDAERHVVILERRKQQGAEGDAGGQRKIFGITFPKKE